MKRTLIAFAALIVLLLLYSVFFQVRFDEMAVVTRFGKALDGAVYNRQADSDKDSGLHFKLPYPIEAVRTYDKRVQIYDDRPEEQQTRDNVAVVVQSYLAWRITDPLHFYRSLRTIEEAEKVLRDKLRDARRVIGQRYVFEDMVNTDPSKLKLRDMEQDIKTRMSTDFEAAAQKDRPYGIELVDVGIKRILLAPKTTEAVFDRMKRTRQRMAEKTLREGDSIAEAIKSDAKGKADTIRTFADARARQIRAQGDQAAKEFLKVFSQDENFAILQRMIDTQRAIFADGAQGKTTLIIDAQKDPLFNFLLSPPSAPPAGGKVQAPATPSQELQPTAVHK
jgi:modulator of FtsH protease HflC